jgi:tRNA(Ile)-lysidine synthase
LRPEGALGLAVSGGSDSMALMRLAAAWASARGVALSVATVDHGLRPEAAEEAAFVAARAAALGLPHETLRWAGWDGAGNLQNMAREARTRLLAGWAAEAGLGAVALGHTRDDQAETVLLNLARGSGVDGLSGMAERSARGGAVWLRPLLGLARADLRAWLSAEGESWREDPSNADLRFDRVKARVALEALAPLGLGAEGLAATATRLRRARAALEQEAAALARRAGRLGPCGEIALDRAVLADAPEEIALRVLADALRAVSGAVYRPRLAALEALRDAALDGSETARTLHGCIVLIGGAQTVMAREPAAIASRRRGGRGMGRPLAHRAARGRRGRAARRGRSGGALRGREGG